MLRLPRRSIGLALFGAVCGAAFILLAFAASPARAGGWFVVTLDSLPSSPVAGETMTIGFVVRQHGQHPVFWGGLSVVAHNPTTGQTLRVAPIETAEIGRYTADIGFPSQGLWEWGIDVDRQPWVRWAPLTVLAPQTTAAVEPALSAPSRTPSWLPVLLALGTAGLFLTALWVGRQRRALGGLIGLAAVAGAVALVMTVAGSPGVVATASNVPVAPVVVDPVAGDGSIAEGRALFLAKGCVTCHDHAGAPSQGFTSVSIGPVLSHYKAPSDSPFLRQWLADPASLRPATQMPDLDLSEHEIESLIAFLGSSSP